LPAPHRTGVSVPAQHGSITAAIELPRVPREPSDLRALVGQRDTREPFAIVLGWLRDLGLTVGAASDGPALVAWAYSAGRLGVPGEPTRPGDVLVFDHAVGDDEADLIALVIGRDARGVTEFVYAGGGVIRRGFLDPVRPSIRRDVDGAVVNTFLRHGKQWPPKGTRYLAGELLAHVIHTR
jgi:hypothetical protein